MRRSIAWLGNGGYILLLFLQLLLIPVSAQTPGLNFRYLTTRDGLSRDIIRCIYQDKDGFMWIGSEGGLDRYDGRSFLSYYNQVRDSTINVAQNTWKIYEDSFDGIWFCNDTNGLVLLNKRKESYTRFRHKPGDSFSLPGNNVRSILEDSNKNLWIATFGTGLSLYNRNDNTFTHYHHDSSAITGIGSNYITSIAEDHKGIIWLASTDGLLIRFDPSNGEFENIRVSEGLTFFPRSLNSPTLLVDADDNIWYANGQNLFRYKQEDKSLRSYPLIISRGTPLFYSVTSLLEIEKALFLVTTDNAGLYLLNSKTGEFVNYSHNPANPLGINSDRISCIFRSDEGVIWIGTSDNGINIFSKNALRFPQLLNLVDAQYLKYSSHSTFSFCEAPDGQILLGTDNFGIFVYNPKKGTLRSLIPELQNVSIFDMLKDKNNNIWICTVSKGLLLYNWQTGGLKHINSLPEHSSSVVGNNVARIIEDHKSRLWIGYMGDGVDMYDRTTKTIKKFRYKPDDPNSLSNSLVFKLFEDSRGNIWIGTSSGLNLFDQQKQSFKQIPIKDENGKDIFGALIFDIVEDSKGRIWIGSSLALNCYDTKTKSCKNYSHRIDDILISVVRVLEDQAHFLWIGTNFGISRFDPETGLFKDFGKSDGIHYLANNPTSGMVSHNGFMYFGSSKGVTVFNPKNITDDNYIPPVFITGLRVNDLQITMGMEDPILSQSINYAEDIKLNYKQSTLSFSFAALNYSNPEANQYLYQLIGYDNGWIRSGNSNTAFYPKLPPGKYIFKVIASNSHGVWNKAGKQIMIVITPPFWRTLWFRLLILIAITLMILFIYFNRIYGLQRQKAKLEVIVSQRTRDLNTANLTLTEQHEELVLQHEEITAQNDMLSNMSEEIISQNAELEQHRSHLEMLVEDRTKELKIARHKAEESDKLKSSFLANMSHEIRTPMNAIVGFANLLRDEEIDAKEKREYIEIINSNSEILLVLIDDILDLSLIEANQLTIRKEVIDINEIVDNLFSSFSHMKTKEDLVIKLNNELQDLHLKIETDQVRIKQILSNLMNNAYKFTEQGFIELGLKKKDDMLLFYIRDTGIGIDENDIDKIFERFRKSDLGSGVIYRGTGLGLAISKALAGLLGGSLTVESAFGKGSIFNLLLPYSLVSRKEPIFKPDTASVDTHKWKDKNIMVVEDEKANYLYARKILTKTDANIYWAKNGIEAVELASSGIHFHLILMDIKMPVMDGFEATTRIKTDHPEQVVIALTAYARPEDQNHFMQAGFNDYLTKPIKPNDFIEVVRRYI